MLTIFAFVPLMVLYAVFGLVKLSISVVLQIYHGDNYGGMLRYGDNNFQETNKDTENLINAIMLIKFDSSKGRFTDYARDFMEKKVFKIKRLTSLRKSFLGYQYLLCNQISVDDIFTTMKFSKTGTCDQKTLCEQVERYYHKPLPVNNTATFEMIVAEEPILLDNATSNDEQYALYLRGHHSVCDALTVLSCIQGMSDEGIPSMESINLKSVSNWEMLKHMLSWNANIIPPLSRKDNNSLKVPKLSEHKHLAFMMLPKRYVEQIKVIKNSIPNGAFTGVLFAGLSAALYTYFKEVIIFLFLT